MVVTEQMLNAMDPHAREALLAAIKAAEEINVKAELKTYTPKKGNRGEGTYLITEVGEAKPVWVRLNDGNTLNNEGRQVLQKLSDAINAHI